MNETKINNQLSWLDDRMFWLVGKYSCMVRRLILHHADAAKLLKEAGMPPDSKDLMYYHGHTIPILASEDMVEGELGLVMDPLALRDGVRELICNRLADPPGKEIAP